LNADNNLQQHFKNVKGSFILNETLSDFIKIIFPVISQNTVVIDAFFILQIPLFVLHLKRHSNL
jgi:hypothetical protein